MPRHVAPPAAATPPHAVLTNGVLRMTAFIPDLDCGFYRGFRFDRGLMLHDITAHGRRYSMFFAEDGAAPTHHDAVTGPAEEFDIEGPQTYEPAPVGGAFLKIGVGVLRRSGKGPYSFAKPCVLLDPGAWRTVVESPRELIVEHKAALPGGTYGYQLHRRVLLSASGARLRIERALTNTGKRKLLTTHYNHNFMRIDEFPVGPDYVIETPFRLQAPRPLREPGVLFGRRLTWTAPLVSPFHTHLGGQTEGEPKHHAFAIRHAAGGAIRYSTDAPLADFRVFATPRAICPEPFTRIELAPGKSFSWNSQLVFEKY